MKTEYCKVTHPKMPNHDSHARGRSVHIVKEGTKLSICNMLVSGIAKTDNEIFIYLCKKRCKICFKNHTI